MGFYYKQDLTKPINDYLKINEDIYFDEDKYESKYFGLTPRNKPTVESFLKFMKQPILYIGAYSSNALGFSCQVPATITYLVNEDFAELINSLNLNFRFSIIKFVPKEFVEILSSPLESMIIDCYMNDLYTYSDQSNGHEDMKAIVKNKMNKFYNLCEKNNLNFSLIETRIISNLEFISIMYLYLKDLEWEELDYKIQINYRLRDK